MPKLIINQADDDLVEKLRCQAISHGVSVEEEHLRILSLALKHQPAPRSCKQTFKEFLLEGEPWPDDFMIPRSEDCNEHRRIEFA